MAYTAWRVLGGTGRVLDFGCGPLDKTSLFPRVGLDVVAFDDFMDSWHREGTNLEKIRSFGEKAGIEVLVAGEEPSGLDCLGEGYDMIMLHHVLEHLKDSPRELLNDLVGRLKPGGLLYVTVPNAVNLRKRIEVLRGRTNYPKYSSYYWAMNEYRGHIREHVLDDLLQLASFLRLEVVEATHYNHFWHAVPRRLQTGVRILCTLVPSLCDSCALVSRKPSKWAPNDRLSDKDLHAAMNSSVPFDYSAVLGDADGASGV
jgi:SAM-dependent methyltransferase